MSASLHHFLNDLTGLNDGMLILISITINIIISILGFIPSVFLTAFNLSAFGFAPGIGVSIAGESIGAIISFYLFRKGLRLKGIDSILTNKYFQRLKEASGAEWIFLLFFFRIVPFIPSSVVTVAAAFSSISILPFSVISTVGKIPSLLIEALIVAELLNVTRGNMILAAVTVGIGVLYGVYRYGRRMVGR
ncbi:TVP38/TMEM64 family protein [Bacillus sp. KH172YL63]|uniref:TVP38/TMEM64 family protein n=1 Tax=Bacillus sp. KH172YL63 TaxID=2709784 RepID=UPI0013E4A2EB|nr:VTT domain-containing protein [Bacillus sp. KH172YL63]BCB03652.1 hypothetical protein KH172YL63_17850 [Bacillus sp. KH172YL63]